jgi:hypothetical protein
LADQDWIEKEKKQPGKMGRSLSDHDKKIEEFAGNIFVEDTDPTNGSSIAFLLSFRNIKGLFLADGHPSDIVSAIRKLKFTETCPLLLSFVKLSHHGSKGNTSPELLSLIRTPVYAITANGISNKHPDKETLSRILCYNTSIGQPLRFAFAANTKEIKSLFKVDVNPHEQYNFTCTYTPEDELQTSLAYLPIIKTNDQ